MTLRPDLQAIVDSEELHQALCASVTVKLRKQMRDAREEARELRRQADALDHEVWETLEFVICEQWWKLRGKLTDDEIEVFSECSPTDLLFEEDEQNSDPGPPCEG